MWSCRDEDAGPGGGHSSAKLQAGLERWLTALKAAAERR